MNTTTITALSAVALICTTLAPRAQASSAPDNVIAKTLYAEARGENYAGIDAVATVIFNRGKGDYQKSIAACLKRKQFSCWNGQTDIKISNNVLDQKMWKYCLHVEMLIRCGNFTPNGNWNHYAHHTVKTKWFRMMTNKTRIGAHVFGYLA